VPVLSIFFIRVFSPINSPSFLRKYFTQACSPITFAVSHLIIKYLSLMVNPIVAEEIYKMPELRCRYQRILIHQFNNFYTVKILIYSAILTEIFMQFNNAVYMEVSQMSAVTLLYTLCC